MKEISRRQAVLMGLSLPLAPLISGCRASLPAMPVGSDEGAANALLQSSAEAHGLAAYASIEDLNVSYAGHWRRLVGLIQPILVDSGFRGGSEERMLPRAGICAQAHSGPQGSKQVLSVATRSEGNHVQVWYNGAESHQQARIDAAALVVEAYKLFLLGPMLLVANEAPRRKIQAALMGVSEITQTGHRHRCNILNLTASPGLGNSEQDQLALYIDAESHLMRRVRMTLNGLESTRGALVDVDTYGHRALHGIMWPTGFHERLLRPAPLDVHQWRLTGLDINRGETRADLQGSAFAGKAVAAARPLAD